MKRKSILFFSDDELKCKKTGIVKLDPVFDEKLTELRKKIDRPMGVNSCCRSLEHNQAVGGAKKSFHIYDFPAWEGLEGTAAIDIRYTNELTRNYMARIAWENGWRIGIHPNFLHFDIAAIKGLLPQAIFGYSGSVTDKELIEFRKQITGE
jgi:hypothetical protein